MKGKVLLSLSAFALMLTVFTAPEAARAGWNISIGINVPGFFYYEPTPGPPVMYGPVAPAVEPAYFYGGLWYRPAGGRWFIAVQLEGPWSYVMTENVPAAVIGVPAYQGPGQDAEGRYIAPRVYYGEDDE